jgi:hypothetical protein
MGINNGGKFDARSCIKIEVSVAVYDAILSICAPPINVCYYFISFIFLSFCAFFYLFLFLPPTYG